MGLNSVAALSHFYTIQKSFPVGSIDTASALPSQFGLSIIVGASRYLHRYPRTTPYTTRWRKQTRWVIIRPELLMVDTIQNGDNRLGQLR